MAITVYLFGASPDAEFSEGGLLHGYDAEHPSIWDGSEAARWGALYVALDVSEDDEEMNPAVLPDGRFALFGLTVGGHPFAIEAE